MRVIATADLHYGMRPAWDAAVRDLARKIVERKPDVIVVAGDVAVADPRQIVACLSLFDESPATKLVVPGNHDIWTVPDGQGADSLAIYERIFPKAAKLTGFHTLDRSPRIVDGVGFVGSMGWYDYAFADERLDAPRGYYERKTFPGVGAWNDGRFVRWKYDDASFTRAVLERLAEHIRAVRNEASHIVAVTHHLAFERLVERRRHRGWAFNNAFMGTPRMGELFLAEPKVCLNVCGHSHHAQRVRIGHVEVVNVGSTYTKKRFLTCEVGRTGLHSVIGEGIGR